MGGVNLSTKEIVDALRRYNGLVTLAAEALHCTPQAIYKRKRGEKAIQEAITDARASLVDMAETALKSAVLSQQGWAVCLVLKTLGKDRGYVERQELTGAEGGPLTFKVIWDEDDS